jgi:hypothetical protein
VRVQGLGKALRLLVLLPSFQRFYQNIQVSEALPVLREAELPLRVRGIDGRFSCRGRGSRFKLRQPCFQRGQGIPHPPDIFTKLLRFAWRFLTQGAAAQRERGGAK